MVLLSIDTNTDMSFDSFEINHSIFKLQDDVSGVFLLILLYSFYRIYDFRKNHVRLYHFFLLITLERTTG